MSSTIHPSAVIHLKATLGDQITIGPFCYVGEHVRLDNNVKLVSHVHVEGRTHIGEGTIVYPFASLGTAPQDLKYKGEPSQLIIGKNNKIREHVTMNLGTEGGGMITKVGDHCLFMVGVHIAHDCHVGNHVILANNATLAGHVTIGDHAFLGGLSAVHQFVRIGAHAMIGGMSGVEADVIPCGLVKGERAYLAGLNFVGLERRGYTKDDMNTLRTAFKSLFHDGETLADRLTKIEKDYKGNALVALVSGFLRERGSRAITLPK